MRGSLGQTPTGLVLAAGILVAVSTAGADARGKTTIALNGLIVDVDEESGAVVGLSHPATGVILRARGGDGGLIDLAYPVECFVPMRLASRFSKARVITEADGVNIHYDPLGPSRTHCPLPDGMVKAAVTLRAAEDGRSVVLKCRIDNQSSAWIPQVLFPDLRGLRPFEGSEGTVLRLSNGSVRPFAGPPKPTAGAPFYAFEDGWRKFEYGGFYNPHVLRWLDLGGYRGGLSMFEKQWGGANVPDLLIQRVEVDPESLRLAWEHRVTIKPGENWTSPEYWLTPHSGGWAKGIEVFRDYVHQVNPPREPPRRIREGLGFQTIIMMQKLETDPKRVAFRFTDLPRVASDAKQHGIDQIAAWFVFQGFHVPLELHTLLGTRQEFLAGVRRAGELGVDIGPFVSISLLTKPSLQRYGIKNAAPRWIYHPEFVRPLDPYYQKRRYPVLGWEISGAPIANEQYQGDVLDSFKSWIDEGVTSWGWDVVCSKQADGTMGPVVGLLEKVRSMAREKDTQSDTVA